MDKHFYVKRIKDILCQKEIALVFIFQEGEWPERDQLLLHVCLFKSSFSFLDDDDETSLSYLFLWWRGRQKPLYPITSWWSRWRRKRRSLIIINGPFQFHNLAISIFYNNPNQLSIKTHVRPSKHHRKVKLVMKKSRLVEIWRQWCRWQLWW